MKLLIGCTNRTDWNTYWHITLGSGLPFLYDCHGSSQLQAIIQQGMICLSYATIGKFMEDPIPYKVQIEVCISGSKCLSGLSVLWNMVFNQWKYLYWKKSLLSRTGSEPFCNNDTNLSTSILTMSGHNAFTLLIVNSVNDKYKIFTTIILRGRDSW